MEFDADKQTLDDLEIFDAFKRENSVFGIFNHTTTVGGKNRLIDMFSKPFTNIVHIQERVDGIRFFETEWHLLKWDRQSIDFVEYYLSQGNYPTRKKSYFSAVEDALMYKLKPTEEYYIIERGIGYLVGLLNQLRVFYENIGDDCPPLIKRYKDHFWQTFTKEEIVSISGAKSLTKIGISKIANYDYMFRYTHRDNVKAILDTVYEYDAFRAVEQTKKERGYVFPTFLSGSETKVEITELYHPFLKHPIANDVSMDMNSNMLFITGPNMAGKSTFLKSFGIAVYLAHMGFPVPAKVMQLSVLLGLSTTINLSDNLDKQQSHFYAEVLRIKDVANKIKEKKRMLVIFDELFRGTNVKDASDGSFAVISAFAEVKTSLFAVSTHISEISERIGRRKNVLFRCFSANNKGGAPEYTYKLENGVTEDRLGMYIIDKEKVIETINSINKN